MYLILSLVASFVATQRFQEDLPRVLKAGRASEWTFPASASRSTSASASAQAHPAARALKQRILEYERPSEYGKESMRRGEQRAVRERDRDDKECDE